MKQIAKRGMQFLPIAAGIVLLVMLIRLMGCTFAVRLESLAQ